MWNIFHPNFEADSNFKKVKRLFKHTENTANAAFSPNIQNYTFIKKFQLESQIYILFESSESSESTQSDN